MFWRRSTSVDTIGPATEPVMSLTTGIKGPDGGTRGGTLVFAGTPKDLLDADGSLTGQYLRHDQPVGA